MMKLKHTIFAITGLLATALLAPSCTTDDDGSMPGDDSQRTPVRLIAGIQQVATPATDTRTAPGGTDGTQAVWTKYDQIGVFMLPTGGKIPADTLPGAHNVPYKVDPATGELTQLLEGLVYDPATGGAKPGVFTPMYYPSTDEAVDFVAYYPYFVPLEIDNPTAGIPPYMHTKILYDQTTAEKQYIHDILYSDNARNIHRSKDPVELRFRHLMAKLRLDITLGEGFEHGEVTKVTLPGMPFDVHFDMRDGSVNKIDPPLPGGNIISCLPLPSPAAGTGAAASFTAIVPPHEGAKFKGRKITVTVDGEDYTGTIPDTDNYAADTLYAYPVRVTPRGLTIGAPNTDVPWTDAKPLPQGYDLTVGNETELRRFAELVNTGGKLPNGTLAAEARVLQTADITLTQEWTPIGNGLNNSFRGAYNGNGNEISGLTIKTMPQPSADQSGVPTSCAGLFGYAEGAVLTGIKLRGVGINITDGGGTTDLFVGSIAGWLENSTLSLCSADGTVNASGGATVNAGGIAGYSEYSTISRCRADVETKAAATNGYTYAGGIAGGIGYYNFILSCESGDRAVTVEGEKSTYAGGIAGFCSDYSFIAFCRTGENNVTARNASIRNYAGGLVGYNAGNLRSCYSRATAEATGAGENRAGAIVGNTFITVSYCYATGATDIGTSSLYPRGDIVYNTNPAPSDIHRLMTGYTDKVESLTRGGKTYYPFTTTYDPSATPAYGIIPQRAVWTKDAWKDGGSDPKYPEINFDYEGGN